MDDTPRYATLRDYLHVLRRHRVLIAVTTVVVAGLALLISVSQTPTYQATASLSFQDIFQNLRFLGASDTTPATPPALRAAQNAQLATRPEVTDRVKQDLRTPLSAAQLAGDVTARVGSLTGLVNIEATSQDPQFAARLANAYAKETRSVGVRQVSNQLAGVRQSILKSIKQNKASPGPGAAFELGTLRQQLTRIETLSRIAHPVQIAARAAVPASPSSPQTSRNVGLGVVVGLFLGLVGAFLRDSLDRKLRTVQDVHEELGMTVLARVPDSALGLAGLAGNGSGPMADTDFESFRVLRQNLGFLAEQRPIRSLLVTSGLPEEGKSTVSMSLASAAAIAGQRVLLVECDLRRPSFASRLGVKWAPGLTDYLLGSASPADILQTVDIGQHAVSGNGNSPQAGEVSSKLVCITAGSIAANPAELLISERFRGFLEQVSKVYDLVVLDSSPLLAVVDALELAPQVDGVIVCVRVQQATRDEARAARTALRNVPERPMGAVVTGLKLGTVSTYAGYYYGD